MSRQDKATTEKHTKMLREMVKRPQNKVCADCKRNDPRWASWNIGVFLCIRCSGIHRGMGTHISKVKSVDLDTWTPEQMQSMHNWGNHRANLYWEAHLKPGHIPPEHKMESFIRSKYESRRWALDGSPPSDPSVLEGGETNGTAAPSQSLTPPPTQQTLVSARPQSPNRSSRQPQPRQLLSVAAAGRSQQPQAGVAPHQPQTQPQPAVPAPQNDLFSLDFHSPPPSSTPRQEVPKKDVKNDILSLFSASSPPPSNTNVSGPFNGGQAHAASSNSFGQWGQAPPQQQQQPQSQTTSFMGTSGTGQWGVQSGWAAPSAPLTQSNLWGNPASTESARQQQPPNGPSLFETSSIWSASGGTNGGPEQMVGSPFASGSTATSMVQKKDDAFGDLWGDFK